MAPLLVLGFKLRVSVSPKPCDADDAASYCYAGDVGCEKRPGSNLALEDRLLPEVEPWVEKIASALRQEREAKSGLPQELEDSKYVSFDDSPSLQNRRALFNHIAFALAVRGEVALVTGRMQNADSAGQAAWVAFLR